MEISNRNGKPRGLGLLCFMAEVRPALVFFLDKNNILDLIKDHRHSILKFVFNRETNRLVVSVDPDIKHRRMARDFFMTTR
jgi:hypothetical protein